MKGENCMNFKSMKYYSCLASKILKNGTKYQRDKDIIASKFKQKSDKTEDHIFFRLTVIDSYYSTQLNKRYFGIEEIAKKIVSISEDDKIMRDKFIKYLEGDDKEIDSLFNENYGITKTGKKGGKAPSLISKYAYFLTSFNFPIYDSLVKVSYPEIIKMYSEYKKLDRLSQNFNKDFFVKMSKLKIESGIKNYDKLDNLLWLFGKLKKGSLYLFIDMDRYKNLVKHINFNGNNSKDISNIIRDYIAKNINSEKLTSIFNDEEFEFVRFCLHEEIEKVKL